jgi:hypothetical protein
MIAQPRISRRRKFWLVSLLLGTLLGLLTGEALVRVLGDTDPDGNFWFFDRRLGPRQPPLARLTSLVEKLEAERGESLVDYDAALGWAWRPGAMRDPYYIDERGIRAGAGAAPNRGGSRVALYGDSVTFGIEVSYEQSWGNQLEELLARTGKDYQVLNLGVGGYGMGQAYLRWRSTRSKLRPNIVVFGLQPENVYRNVNVIRPFYVPQTNLPFSKPRFVLEGDGLGIVNVPCLPPREVLRVLREPRLWEHRRMETFYIEDQREMSFWQRSRLLCLVADRFGGNPLGKRREACFQEDSEAFQVTVRLIQRFHDEVQAAGSRFLIVHLPQQSDLALARAGRPMPHAVLLAELNRHGMTIVDPTRELLELAEREGLTELFQPLRHYGPAANRVVAEVLASNL